MSRIIWAVIAVPTLAPSTMPTDWWKVRKPAPTSPTVITIVAVELCMIHATSIPRRNPITGLLVTLASAVRIAPPEEFFNPSPMTLIP